jgi:hypothetical protein
MMTEPMFIIMIILVICWGIAWVVIAVIMFCSSSSPPTKEELQIYGSKAEKLFMENLTPNQRLDWTLDHYIICIGSYSGRRYKIKHRNPGSKNVIMGGYKYCCYSPTVDNLPDYDVFLIQKLTIELDEDEFRLRSCQTPTVED